MNDLTKNLLLWVVVAVVLMVVFQSFAPRGGTPAVGDASNYTQFLQEVDAGRIKSVEFTDDTTLTTNAIRFKRSDGSEGSLYAPRDEKLIDQLYTKKVDIVRMKPATGPSFWSILLQFLPVLLLIGFWIFMMRQMQGGGGGAKGAMSFGKSRAKLQGEDQIKVTFADVAGCDEAKEEVGELVDFLRDPSKFTKLGGKIPRGVLMVGPPGTGKTLMARAVAGEAGVPFFSISGSEFVEMFVGVGASRVRDLFERAKAEAPAIVFVDEIDAVGRHRGAGLGGGHDEREQTLNQILVEMDGFETGTNVIIIAATNRPDILDPALLRPGRFDRKVIMDNPDIRGRSEILKVHAKGKPLAADVDLESIARITPGFSGADLENLINEAAILAARRNKKSISMSEMQESMERVVMGPERKTRVISEKEKRTVAYHEAGHAILFHVLEHTHPVHKITIIPRGRAGGYVMPLPEDDSGLISREQFEDLITATMGGRAAEEIIFNQLTTGASSDLQQATQRARMMVTQFGMSETLGPRTFGGGTGSLFLGRDLYEQRDYSEHAAEEIDKEVKRILQSAYHRAKTLLTENRDKLESVARVLIERETLDRTSFEDLMAGRELPAMFEAPVEPTPAPPQPDPISEVKTEDSVPPSAPSSDTPLPQ